MAIGNSQSNSVFLLLRSEVVVDGQYVPYECKEETRLETHIKLVPKCVEVTRQDCVTKWITDSRGRKVWDGNEQCTPVMWQNCTLHEEPKEFNQTFTSCTRTGRPIPTMQCNLVEKSRMTSGYRCEVMHAVNCTCTHRYLQFHVCTFSICI